MVSHSVIVAASSPVMTPNPAPTMVSNLPPLMTITKRSVLEGKVVTGKGNSGNGNGNKDLEKLFNIGAKRFDLEDADRDDFSDIYVRALQAALLGAAKRNRATLCKLESLRCSNAKLRAAKVQGRVAAERAASKAAAAKQQQS